jgi:phage tail sheath protein FI
MAVQVSYPGIYIEEFTPGPPIEGVGTSTVGFVGTAQKGPIRRATRLHSWEAFKERFGDFLAEQPASWLAPAVYGFFLNGGTDCFVVREGTAASSVANLLSRKTGSNEPVLVAQAIEEGVQGDAISVEVIDASILDEELGTGASTLNVHFATSKLDAALPTGATADRTKATVNSNKDFVIGETVQVEATGKTPREAVIKDKQGTKTLVFESPVAGNDGFSGGTVRSVDLVQGQREIRVDIPTQPAGFRLDRALPRGTTVLIAAGNKKDYRSVETSRVVAGSGRITLTEGIKNNYVLTTAVPTVASEEFHLVVGRPQETDERFEFLSMHPDHPRYWGTIVDSRRITLREPPQPPAAPDPDPRPKAEKKNLANGADDDRAAAWAALLNDPAPALDELGRMEEVDIVSLPGATTTNLQSKLIADCENRRDRFAILDSAFDSTPDESGIEAHADAVRGSQLGFAALYYPWILAANPRTGRTEYWPPSGHIAGIYARSDARAGVHAAPANANLRGALGLERRLGDLEQGPLNLKGINVLRTFPGQAEPVVWGARTTTLQNKYWQYVNIRRLFLFLENSIEQNIRWAVFQPNNLALWQQLRRVISDFLTKVWQDGALFGATAKEAFYVRIDEALNPESERALGRLHIEIGVAPTYPAEFVIVRIGIWQGGSEVSEA